MKIWKKDYYEKMFAKRAETVQDYQLQIAHAQEKILELQKKCSHPTYEATLYMWRPGAFQPVHVCSSCNAVIGEATEEEKKSLFKPFETQYGTVFKSTVNDSEE